MSIILKSPFLEDVADRPTRLQRAMKLPITGYEYDWEIVLPKLIKAKKDLKCSSCNIKLRVSQRFLCSDFKFLFFSFCLNFFF